MRWQIASSDSNRRASLNYLVLSVAKENQHRFSKRLAPSIVLLKGLGVEGDAHCGKQVQHRSRVLVNPDQPNLRQVHLIAEETLQELREQGFDVSAGDLGENITTSGIDFLSLPLDTRITIGDKIILTLTGLRNPCKQLNDFQPGLMLALLGRDEIGQALMKAGVMAVVTEGGEVTSGDSICIRYPEQPHVRLTRI